MQLRRAFHAVGAGALTGALLLGTAPAAVADDIRDKQWALDAFGAEEIWQKSTGKGIIVAVVDTGVEASHPDLTGQVLKGKDFTEAGGNAQDDTVGHGTGMASLIAGHGHGPGRNSGVKGLAPDARILPIRFQHEADEMGETWAEGVRYAVDHGADVINISQVTSYGSSDEAAIKYAIDNDVVVVAGAGNEGKEEKNYPAAYPGVVSVGGWNQEGAIWEDSSWGSNTTLVAPASDIVSARTTTDSGYGVTSGTSDATAYVSASAALVRAAHPDLTQGQVINRLIETALPLKHADGKTPKLPSKYFGYGVVRPNRALSEDIPAGPKEGPLEQPAGGSSEAGASGKSGDAAEDSSGQTPDWAYAFGPPLVTYAVMFVGGAVVIALLILLLVKVTRKRS